MVPTPQSVPLLDRLVGVANIWSAATGRSLGALSSVVTNHGGFFDRIGTPGAGASTTTLEKFAAWLADPVNWPEGAVPDEAREFAHILGASAPAEAASPGKAGENSPQLGEGA